MDCKLSGQEFCLVSQKLCAGGENARVFSNNCLLKVFLSFFRAALPLCLGELITYFSDSEAGDRISTEHAFLYATGIVISALIPVATFHPFFLYIFQMGIKIRVGCYSLIYKKLLQQSASAADGLNGQVINFLSTDVTNLEIALSFLHDLWKGPLELVVLGYFIYREIGIPSFVGLLFMFAFIPLQAWMGKLSAKYRLQTAKQTDERVRLMNEILYGIQAIKMYAWENSFSATVHKLRSKETSAIRGSLYVQAALISFQVISKVALFLSLVTFVYTSSEPVTARKVFVVSSLYFALHLDFIRFWANAISMWAGTVVSISRINDFLLRDDASKCDAKADAVGGEKEKVVRSRTVTNDRNAPKCVKMNNVTTSWNSSDSQSLFQVSNIHLDLRDTGLWAVVGPVGSGKSTLLHAIIGELEHSSGSLERNGILSYASQEPWLFESSIRQNIVFIEDWHEARYLEVLRVCALERDIQGFARKDHTVVGERGVCLSGGQKARVSLARAIYKQADIYLLDDPLSAVDVHVGQHIFEQCIRGFLRDKIVVLATHQLKVLPDVDHVLVMNQGRIESQGAYREVRESGHLQCLSEAEEQNEKKLMDKKEAAKSENVQLENQPDEQDANCVGAVKWDTYKSYFKSAKSEFFVVFTLILFIFGQVAISCTELFLSKWSTWEESVSRNGTNADESAGDGGVGRQQYIIIYSILISVTIWLVVQKSFSLFKLTLKASLNLHNRLFRGIIRSLMVFFNTNASGWILNRFSKDIGSIDLQLPNNIIEGLSVRNVM